MPSHPFWTNFTSGELTERLDARVDLQKYQNGAHCILNMVVQVHGGCARRAGLAFVAETKSSGAFDEGAFDSEAFETGLSGPVVKLVPFQFSTEQAYILEVGPFYIRVYANRAYLGVEVATPYTSEDVPELRFAQSADVLYIAHQNHAPRKLMRLAATTFQLAVIDFLPPPTIELEQTFPGETLTLTATTGTIGISTANPVFQAGDVGRRIKSGLGQATIYAFGSPVNVDAQVLNAFASTILPGGTWTIDGTANQGTATPSVTGPLYSFATITTSLPAFRTSDFGKYIYLNDGFGRITERPDVALTPTQCAVIIFKEFSSLTPAPAGTWTIEGPTWSVERGYPGVVNLFEQRLQFAGATSTPDAIDASVVGDYENFRRGPLDDDAYHFVIASAEVNRIRWLKSLRRQLIGTIGGEYDATGANDGAISPAAPPLIGETSRWGCDNNVDAVRMWNVVLFLQRGAHKIRELAFDNVEENFHSPDLSILAEHLTREPVVDLAYLPQPDSMLLAVRSDGALLTMTYERPENVVAWAHHHTDGRFLSVAVIPNMCGTGNEVWVVVERQLPTPTGYETHRYLEVFDGGLNTDAALIYEGDPAVTLVGLDHLEDKAVSVIVRDQPFDDQIFDPDIIQEEAMTETSAVVSAGQVSLASPAGQIEIGLPFQCELALLRPEIATQQGSLQGRRQRYNEVTVRLYCTHGNPLINGEAVTYPEGTGFPFTGDCRVLEYGWDREGRIVIRQNASLPITVLGVGGSIQWDNG